MIYHYFLLSLCTFCGSVITGIFIGTHKSVKFPYGAIAVGVLAGLTDLSMALSVLYALLGYICYVGAIRFISEVE